MQRKQKIKYLIAIYTIVASLAVIFWILAYFRANDILQATLLNLATELLGIVFIFFIVNYLFLLDDWDLGERIRRLLDKLESPRKTNSKDFFQPKPPIDKLIKESQFIDLCGVALTTTIDSHLGLIRDGIRNGLEMRVLIMENNDETLKIATSRSEQDDKKYYEKKLESTINNLEFLFSNSSSVSSDFKGRIEIGFLSYPPSFSIKMFRKRNDDGVCIVEMFAHHVGWGDPPLFLLDSKTDNEWYDYFQKQFEAMWHRSKKYEPIREQAQGQVASH